MRIVSWVVAVGVPVLGWVCVSVQAQTVGTTFTYQGELFNNGTPVEGPCDFRFTLHDADTGGTQIGGALVFNAAPVEGGVVTVELNFGANVFDGHERFLEIEAVCPTGGTLQPLSPRQAVRPVPYALALPAMRIEQAGPDPVVGACLDGIFGPNVIGGWHGNAVSPGVVGATIAGGGGVVCLSGNITPFANSVEADFGTVGGGSFNTASGEFATIGGGGGNVATQPHATVGGGTFNTASGNASTIGGGGDNVATQPHATVGGGTFNTASGTESTIGGGRLNTASGNDSTVGGGDGNTASDRWATVSGGVSNTASGRGATVPGGVRNQAGGDFSFAAGRSARIRDATEAGENPSACLGTCGDEGTFVWADATTPNFPGFESTGPNQFLIKAAGGVGIGTNRPDPDRSLTIQGKNISDIAQWVSFKDLDGNVKWHINNQNGGLNFAETGVADRRLFLEAGGNVRIIGGLFVSDVPMGDFGNAQYHQGEQRFYFDNSSRRHKRDIRPLEDEFEKILEAEPKTYTRPGDPNRREIGYIAEEFAELGLDRLVYFDADGAPSAINYRKTAIYLNEVVKKQQKQLAEQKETVADLTARLAKVEAMVAKLAESRKDPVQ